MNKRSLVILSLKLSVLLVLLAIPIAAQPKKVRDQAKTLQDQGDRAFVQKNYREAADKYGQALVLIPNNAYAHYRKGFAHFNLQESEQAINEFTLALSQGFRPVEVYRVRAFIYYELKNYVAALDDIQKGIALAPKDILFLKGLGEVQLALNKYQEALEALRRAAEVAPNDADIQYNMARVYFAMGDSKSQKTAAENALAKGTRFPGEAHYLLADAESKLGNVNAAIEAYQRAISSKPDNLEWPIALASLMRSDARFSDAISTLKAVLIKKPDDGRVYTELSYLYSLARRPKDAVDAGRAGVQYSPTSSIAHAKLCRAYNETREFVLASNECNTALRLKPEDGESYLYLATSLVNQNKSDEATRAYLRAIPGLEDEASKEPTISDKWFLLGNAYFGANQTDKAINSYLKCLNLSPKFFGARLNLGISYVRKKNKASALEQYNLLVSGNRELADILKSEIDKM